MLYVCARSDTIHVYRQGKRYSTRNPSIIFAYAQDNSCNSNPINIPRYVDTVIRVMQSNLGTRLSSYLPLSVMALYALIYVCIHVNIHFDTPMSRKLHLDAKENVYTTNQPIGDQFVHMRARGKTETCAYACGYTRRVFLGIYMCVCTMFMHVCICMTHTHTHTHTYIYMNVHMRWRLTPSTREQATALVFVTVMVTATVTITVTVTVTVTVMVLFQARLLSETDTVCICAGN
jgi:hypothetical protein